LSLEVNPFETFLQFTLFAIEYYDPMELINYAPAQFGWGEITLWATVEVVYFIY